MFKVPPQISSYRKRRGRERYTRYFEKMKDEGEKRQQMMENLFGVNSEDEEEEEEVDSEHESNQHRPNYVSVSFIFLKYSFSSFNLIFIF